MLTLNPKQKLAAEELVRVKNLLLYGGAGSGKTVFALDAQAAVCSTTNARSLTTRRYATDVRASIWNQTLPFVLQQHGFISGKDYRSNEQQMTITFNSGGQIVLAGLDDKERVDKILGQEYAIIYINECQDVPWPTVNILKTRLRQVVDGFENKFMADLNPTTDAHWSYKLWHLHIHPESKEPLKHPEDYSFLKMNPRDNEENLPESYFEELEGLVGNARQRFLLGDYASTTGLRVFNPVGIYDWPQFLEWASTRQGVLKFTAGLDLGYQDADAFAIFAYVPNEPEVWLIYEHKRRRETLDELVTAIRDGMNWVRANVPARDNDIQIYAETATLRYGHEGDEKKTFSMLAEVYGLPVQRAYKRDKKLGIELLQDVVNSGRFKIPRGGPFHDETEQTIWTRLTDGTIERKIDDEAFHPDMMDAVLYPFRELWTYGGDEHRQLPPGDPEPDELSPDETILNRMLETLRTDGGVW
jgi:PBSX family phage terminase large subunit